MRKHTRRALTLLLTLALCLGLLPMAALAEEETGGVSYTITFDASPGIFSDGNTTVVLKTTNVGGQNLIDGQPGSRPVRDGYTFAGWYLDFPGENPDVFHRDFTADATVKADWQAPEIYLDPNGGDLPAGAEKILPLDTSGTAYTLKAALPTPTREGYRFTGWYWKDSNRPDDPIKTGDQLVPGAWLTAKWTKLRTSKTTPSVTASPAKIEAETQKIEITLSCTTSGVVMDWRPLERALYMGGEPSDWEAAAKSLISGNFSDVGLKLTKVYYDHTGITGANDSAYPYEFYPEGVCPASGLVLTLEGKAKAGTLTIQLSGENFLEFVPAGSDTVLDAPSADIFNSAQVKIPVGSANPDGPFTVKFDLNYKNPPKSEIPEDQKVYRGQTVDLPDGAKLTSPFTSHEFYAWCMKGTDGKLYPWAETNPVTADMTLYAGWVRKGTVVKDGEAMPDTSGQPSQPAAPAAPKFTDVTATSPFAPAISWAVEKQITNGKTATTFGPGDPCTRAQIVTFLWRAAGSPEPKLTETQYMDVTDPSAYYYKAVQWAAEMDMEYSGTFDPHKTCDRASAVYFIWKAFGSPKAAAKANFADMPEEPKTGGQWYWPDLLDAVDWAVSKGVTNGTGDGTTFSPNNPCTRGQIVTFLYRAYER